MVVNMMCTRCMQNGKLKTKSVKIGIFGLDNAGKTSTTKAIIGESLETVVPTVGYSSYQKRIGQYDVTFYDLGGGRRVRDIWKHYLAEVHGLIFVIDSTEVDRLVECKEELQKLLSNPRVQGKPILVLANKQDKGNALDDKEIVSRINLEDMVTQNKCHCRLELCSAHVGIGTKVDRAISAGLKWLLRIIDVLRETAGLEQRVIMDTEEAQRIEREQAKEKRLQVQKVREERLKAEKAEGKGETEKDNDAEIDPFKPIEQAIAESTGKIVPVSKPFISESNATKSQAVPPRLEPITLPRNETKSISQAEETSLKLDKLQLATDEPSNSNDSSPHSQTGNADQAARRRRRRPRPNNDTGTAEQGANKMLNEVIEEIPAPTLPVPNTSILSPTLTKSTSRQMSSVAEDKRVSVHSTAALEKADSGDKTAPVAASLRLSGPLGSIEQQNGVAVSTAASFSKQGGPNVTSSDAFI